MSPLHARARRAATDRAAAELWGLGARPAAIAIGRGGLVSLTPGAARYDFEFGFIAISLPITFYVTLHARARRAATGGNKATANQSPLPSLVSEESDPKRTSTRQQLDCTKTL